VATKKKGQQGAKNMKLFYGILAAVAIIGVAAIVYTTKSAGSGDMATEPLQLTQLANADSLTAKAKGISRGDAGAPVDIRVFSDYMCPACATWAGQIEPLLKTEFIETGKVRLTYYDFPLPQHKYSFAAARAARCAADQGKFWEYHDRLFATQREWAFAGTMPVDHFDKLATEAGLNARPFSNCLRGDDHAELVTANRMLGEMLRVSGTPTVYINSQITDKWGDYSAVRAAIQSALPPVPVDSTERR
jgi:protein-disulfide isomerase